MPWFRTLVLAGFVLAVAAPWICRVLRGRSGWVLALGPLAMAVHLGTFIPHTAAGEVFDATHEWVGELGIGFSFYLDGLSLLMSLLISGIGTLVVIYAGGYFGDKPQIGIFYCYLLFFMGSMLGVVLAGDLITLFVFWELTTVSSFLLIGFEHQRASARAAALQGLLVTGAGGLALLAGLVLLGQTAGTFEFAELLGRGEAAEGLGTVVRDSPLYGGILALVLLGAFTKSAQFPFHFWLPNAMEAPTPVSAYLHSATMVKAGVYLLARLSPVLGGTDEWWYAVTSVGTVTMFVGAFMVLLHSDLKRVLAYSTLSVLGTLTLLLGLGRVAGPREHAPIEAMAVVLMAHALYKGAMFLVAGAIDHETGTRDVERLGGLRRAMPVTATAALIAAVSMAGLLPAFGFVAKELFYEALIPAEGPWIYEEGPNVVITSLAIVSSMLLVMAAVLVGVRPFWGKVVATPKPAHEGPVSLWIGPLLLAVFGLAVGLLPGLLAQPLVFPAAAAVLGEPVVEFHDLKMWHGFNRLLAASLATLVGGIAIYLARDGLHRRLARLPFLSRWGPSRVYDWGLIALNVIASRQTRFLQSGYLRTYLMIILLTVLVLVGRTLLTARFEWPRWWDDLHLYEAVLGAVILVAGFVATLSTSRFEAVAALGVVGYGVALVFILHGAPDLAMTQFVFETLIIILFVLVFLHLPRFETLSSRLVRIRDMTVSLIFGGMMAALLLISTEAGSNAVPNPDQTVSEFFARESYPAAHGRNIVNVILVDFRALDTLGEITVLAVAGIGVFALLRLVPRRRRKDEQEEVRSEDGGEKIEERG